jgi:hypothetical protein
MLHDTGRRGAAARFSRRLQSCGVKLDRLDGHPESKKWDIVGPQSFSKGPRKPRSAASNRRQTTQDYRHVVTAISLTRQRQ